MGRGLIVFVRRQPAIGLLLTTAFVAQVYVNSVVSIWWGGSGFGARRFASSGLVFAIGLAAMLDWLRRRPALGAAAVVGTLVVANLFFMSDVRLGRLPSGERVTFEQMINSTYSRVGSPFSFPANMLYAWRYGTSLVQYDQLGGREYSNLLIDLGEEHDGQFLTTGWSERERERGMSFRWAVTAESRLVVPVRRRADHLLEFRAQPFTYPGAPAQSVSISVNGEVVAEYELEAGMTEYRVEVPSQYVGRNLNEIRFQYGYARSPLEVGVSADPRPLAVRFDYLRFQQR